MSKKSIAVVILFLCFVVFPRASAEAMTTGEIASRLEEIIKQMQSLKAEFDSLVNTASNQPKPNVLGVSTGNRLKEDLQYGVTNDDIGLIQKLLRTDASIYPYGVVSGFFGPKTEEAIRNLQTRFGLDPVGAIGPATKDLLEAFLAKYPSEDFPADALKSDPRKAVPAVAGASTVNTTTQVASPTTSTPKPIGSIKAIRANQVGGGYEVAIYYKNDNVKEFRITSGSDRSSVVKAVSDKSGLSIDTVNSLLVFGEIVEKIKGDEEDEAEEAIDEAKDAIKDAEDEIEEADEDGDDVDWAEDTLEEAEDLLEEAEEAFDEEDYDEAIDLAKEAEDMAKEAVDRIDEEEDSKGDEIEEIRAKVLNNVTEVKVVYEDGDKDEFDISEDEPDDIVEAIADELDLDEDEVEDLIEYNFGDIASIDVDVGDDEAEVNIKFNSGVKFKFIIDADDEDEMIEAIADYLDLDEDDVEDVVDFD